LLTSPSPSRRRASADGISGLLRRAGRVPGEPGPAGSWGGGVMGFDGPRTASSPSSATFWISDILDHYCHHITLEGNSASYYGTRYGTRRYCTVIYFSLHHITVQGDITSCYGIRKCSIILRYKEIYYGTRRYYIMLRYSGKITLQGYSAGQQALLFGMGCSGCSAAQRRSAKAPKHRSTKAQRSVVSRSDKTAPRQVCLAAP
jgi:hypothetical protein